MRRKPQLLVVDDGEVYARIVAERMPEFQLVKAGGAREASRLPDGPSALEFLEKNHRLVDVVLLDVHFDVPEERLLPLEGSTSLRRTKRFQGVAILDEIRRRFPELPVVLLTAVEDLSLVDAGGELKSQSMTYFLDGDDLDSLRVRINAALQEAASAVEESGVLWGSAPSMRALRRRLAVLARGGLPVILEGETGTGKSFLAERFLHANSGRSGPFVTLDLATIPRELVAAHLFGAVKGAYTGAVADRKGAFETAHRGTLFLDEVQNIPPDVQRQLLVVLQDRRVRPLGSTREIDVDVKVIAATNSRLADAVTEHKFRPDLYMRLSPATQVVIPPLRDRPGDLEFLARRFVATALKEPENAELKERIAPTLGLSPGVSAQLVIGRKQGKKESGDIVLSMPGPVWKMLAAHSWPGNVRELQMVMHNIVTFTLVGVADAIREGLPLSSPRFQVDPGLVSSLLEGYVLPDAKGKADDHEGGGINVSLEPQETLNAVSNSVERQYFQTLFEQTKGDFAAMAETLLGDPDKARAVRLRFNQLGLKVRELLRR